MPLSSTTQHQRIVWWKTTTSIVNSFIYCHGRTQSCLQSAWHPQLGDQFANLWGFRRCTGKQTLNPIWDSKRSTRKRGQSGTWCDKACAWNCVSTKRNENALIVQLESNNTHTHFVRALEEDDSFIHQETSLSFKLCQFFDIIQCTHCLTHKNLCIATVVFKWSTTIEQRTIWFMWYSSSHLDNSMASSVVIRVNKSDITERRTFRKRRRRGWFSSLLKIAANQDS